MKKIIDFVLNMDENVKFNMYCKGMNNFIMYLYCENRFIFFRLNYMFEFLCIEK